MLGFLDGSDINTNTASPLRPIRSYVRRSRRLTRGQVRALETLQQRYVVAPSEYFNCQQVYGRQAPGCIEVGCGNGDTLLALARTNPNRDYLGIEVHLPGIGRTLAELDKQGITNVRLMIGDAAQLFSQRMVGEGWNQLLIYFPDPWSKKRHHKRRLISTSFVADVCGLLELGGQLRIATDWPDYAEYILEILNQQPELRNWSPGKTWVARAADRPLTRFEHRAHLQGRAALDLAFERVDA